MTMPQTTSNGVEVLLMSMGNGGPDFTMRMSSLRFEGTYSSLHRLAHILTGNLVVVKKCLAVLRVSDVKAAENLLEED